MNDKVFNPLGYMVDKAEVEKMLVQIKQQYSEKERKSLEETLKPKELSLPTIWRIHCNTSYSR